MAHSTPSSGAWRRGEPQLCGETDDLELHGGVGFGQNSLNPRHDCILDQELPAALALQHGKPLQDDDGVFGNFVGVSVSTLRNWEQGRRVPEGPARALLRVAAEKPQAVIEALWKVGKPNVA